MTGKKKTMKGGGEDAQIRKMLKKLDELYNLLTKQDQGWFNNKLFESRLKGFFELLKKILSEDLLSKLYINNLDGQLAILLELFEKFKKISLIKNSGSQEILTLFRVNILLMTQEAGEMFTKLSKKIIENIRLGKNSSTNQPSVNIFDIRSVEYYFDFVIRLINVLVTTFKKNTNTTNAELAKVKRIFDSMIKQYLDYLHILDNDDTPQYLPLEFKISNILSKRNLTSVENYSNKMKKLHNTFFSNIQRVESRRINLANLGKLNSQQKYYVSTNNNHIMYLEQEINNYNSILQRLKKKYSHTDYSLDISTLAYIESQIESIRRMYTGNNRTKKIIKLKNFMEIFKLRSFNHKYPEFQEYENNIESISAQ
jgi:hypothetical protein